MYVLYTVYTYDKIRYRDCYSIDVKYSILNKHYDTWWHMQQWGTGKHQWSILWTSCPLSGQYFDIAITSRGQASYLTVIDREFRV